MDQVRMKLEKKINDLLRSRGCVPEEMAEVELQKRFTQFVLVPCRVKLRDQIDGNNFESQISVTNLN